MCGIALAVGGDRTVVERAARTMAGFLRHRGPDDEGLWISRAGDDAPWIALGHRRLSILDLSPLGHQPMLHPVSGDALIYNGELYNYADLRKRLERRGVAFKSACDTEVLLHALCEWGDDALEELAGMYAFAFFHRASGRILLARDPMGIKPLYIASTPAGFLAASEVRAILATGLVDPKVDACGLASYLAYGALQSPFTLFEGVRSAAAAQAAWLRFDYEGRVTNSQQRRFWSFPAVDRTLTEQTATLHLRDAMTQAVREHLVADVPVGIFLSSGIDSTVIAGLARKASSEVRTFTLGFYDQPDLSESDAAYRIANRLGTRHYDIQITGPDALSATRDWIRTIDQPSIDGLNTFVISRAVREAGVVVALSGLGGDELFAGYSSFRDVPRMYRALMRLRHAPKGLRRGAFRLASLSLTPSVRAKLHGMVGVGPDLARLCLERRRTMSDEAIASLGLSQPISGLDRSWVAPELIEDLGYLDDPVAAVSQMEARTYMRHMLLRDSDCVSMRHSLELRVPMLDRRVLDLAFSIPGHLRCPDGRPSKHLLRRAFADLLTPDILARPKRGFTLPIRRWMHGPMREFCEASLAYLRSAGLLDPHGVSTHWDRFIANPEDRVWSSTFGLIVLGTYLDLVTRPARAPSIDAPAAVDNAPIPRPGPSEAKSV